MPLLFLAVASFLLIFFTLEFYFEYKTFECNWAKVLVRVISFRTKGRYRSIVVPVVPPFGNRLTFSIHERTEFRCGRERIKTGDSCFRRKGIRARCSGFQGYREK